VAQQEIEGDAGLRQADIETTCARCIVTVQIGRLTDADAYDRGP
jgi:hypothetical protein